MEGVTETNTKNEANYTEILGQGAFGIVLKSTDTFGNPVAVKYVFPDRHSPDADKLDREFTLMKDLEGHPNIVQIINLAERQYCADINGIFKKLPATEENSREKAKLEEKLDNFRSSIRLVMELCGETLRTWLDNELADDRKVGEDITVTHISTEIHTQVRQMTIVQNLLSGLSYLHSHKIMHRDLKPANILFSRSGFKLPVKIGDFGHCRLIHSEESYTGSLTNYVGTPTYMAPEIRDGDYSYQADFYSLGLVIWEVVQLIRTAHRKFLFEKLVYDKKTDLVVDHPVMPGIRNIIIGMTRRKPEKRIEKMDLDFSRWDDIVQQGIDANGCRAIWNTISNSGAEYVVENSEGLKLAMDNISKGGIIYMKAGVYVGEFVLRGNEVTISGVRVGLTIIKCLEKDGTFIRRTGVAFMMHVGGFGCGLKVIGSRNTVTNIEFHGGDKNVDIIGDANVFENLTLSSAFGVGGIWIQGSNNTISEVELRNIRTGICLLPNSDHNKISNVTGTNIQEGVRIHGSFNRLSNINLRIDCELGYALKGVYLSTGSNNTINGVECSGYRRQQDHWGVVINSPNTTVENCRCGPLLVDEGGNNATIVNVHCGELFQVHNTVKENINLTNCTTTLREKFTVTIVKDEMTVTKPHNDPTKEPETYQVYLHTAAEGY
ncbi:calcium-dependent protein kinase 14-like [Folsomia candida]|uniref:calcium-dependent protein kinase 14-like n=1 Tax=Folsomia candida TaxID=158441 RepID=UPI001604B0A1|nr:calcium-dependent protein kinase 14-like [Folsomia candida]